MIGKRRRFCCHAALPMTSAPRSLLPALLAVLLSLAPVSRGALAWETDYTAVLARAKKEMRPICLIYAPTSVKPPASFGDPMVEGALKEFICVQAYDEQKTQVEKFTRKRGGYPAYFFIDSASENLLASDGGFGIPALKLMKSITKARSEIGLPLTASMQRSLAMEFKPDKKIITDMTEAGDLAGLVAYLKPVESDEFREFDYLAVRVKFPPSVSHGDVACVVAGKNPVVRPSGVCLAYVVRDGKPAAVKITAPGCAEIVDSIPLGPGGLLGREYQLTPLAKEQAASFTGRVSHPGGAPAGNAIVRICDTGIVVRADSSGRFHATGIPPGTFLVRAEAPDGEFHKQLTFAPGRKLSEDLPLTQAGTVGIRWALQTREGSRSLAGEGVRTGEAYFSVAHSRFILERGAEVRESWGSDLKLALFAESSRQYITPAALAHGKDLKVGDIVFSFIDSTARPTGMHLETAKFDAITAVNGGLPFDEKTYFEFVRSFPVRVGDVFTLRCVRRDCYAKLEVIQVSAQKP